jgi:polyhydroxyalkanoate synthase
MPQETPDPARWLADLMRAQQDMQETMQQLAAPWASFWASAWPSTAAAAEPAGDKRFAGEAWSKDPRFAALARTYVAQTEQLQAALSAAPLDERSKAQWGFALRQLTDALSPANMLATNPEALQLAMETGGASLADGLRLFTEDLARGRIAMTDETAFEVGGNVATTAGSVIYENELMQLIQYSPATGTVHERPLVIVPPCINKYYILDLQPKNSFIAYAVAQHQTVFLVSWRNAGPGQAKLTWDDYLEQGVLQAIEVARRITGAGQVNTLGFCIGGTLLASALAVQAARGEHPAASMTLLTTMLDFTDTGEIGLLVDEPGVIAREAAIGRGGLLQGSELAQVFAALRANDLIWPYVVQGYLQGKAPPAFDLLYWNSDGTNLPGPMFCWYLRNTYLENKLREPGGTVQCGQPVDLGSVTAPAFVYASKDDHIVPWTTAYASTQLLAGDTTFVLGASGHIAGVINPPVKNKRNYWKLSTTEIDPGTWLDAAESVPGSWWPAWTSWLEPYGGEQVPAPREPGSSEFAPIEPAPGRYVKEQAS